MTVHYSRVERNNNLVITILENLAQVYVENKKVFHRTTSHELARDIFWRN